MARQRPARLRHAAIAATRKGDRAQSPDQSRLKVVIPHVEMHRVVRRGLRSPQLSRGEAHRVHVLTLLTLKVRVGVGEHIDAVIASHDSGLAARVSGQSRMASGMDVAGANTLADLERRSNLWINARRYSAAQPTRGCRQRKHGSLCARSGAAFPLFSSSCVTKPYFTTWVSSLFNQRS